MCLVPITATANNSDLLSCAGTEHFTQYNHLWDYSIIFFSMLSDDVNFVARARDGKKTMHYCLLFFIVGPITCEIGTFVWFHNISHRIGEEARMRGIRTSFGATSFWLWNVLGALILVGPFIYMYQLCKTMNQIGESFNANGR